MIERNVSNQSQFYKNNPFAHKATTNPFGGVLYMYVYIDVELMNWNNLILVCCLGVAQEGASPRDLLPGVEVAWPPVPSWAQAFGTLSVPVLCQTEGRLYQPVPLQESWEPW
jgi:hypothetical protein